MMQYFKGIKEKLWPRKYDMEAEEDSKKRLKTEKGS